MTFLQHIFNGLLYMAGRQYGIMFISGGVAIALIGLVFYLLFKRR